MGKRLFRQVGTGLLMAVGAGLIPSVRAVTGGSTTSSNNSPWNHVGTINGASGVFLGDINGSDWVLTAGHVGLGNFTINGTTYTAVANSAESFFDTNGNQADLTLFKITGGPSVSILNLGGTTTGESVEMVGYGGGKSWGTNSVAGYSTYTLNGYPYKTVGIVTLQSGGAQATGGDSGGGLFVDVAGTWLLGGIMSGVGDLTTTSGGVTTDLGQGTFSVDLAYYANSIIADIIGASAVPEPPATAVLAGLTALAGAGLSRRRLRRAVEVTRVS